MRRLRTAVVAVSVERPAVTSADTADDALADGWHRSMTSDCTTAKSAMATWLEIVKLYSGTTVAEDASWRIAQVLRIGIEQYARGNRCLQLVLEELSAQRPRPAKHRLRSPKATNTLGNWVEAMDAYTNYINNYPQGTMVNKAKEQIAWIKTYRL